jgi:hypothetical protein
MRLGLDNWMYDGSAPVPSAPSQFPSSFDLSNFGATPFDNQFDHTFPGDPEYNLDFDFDPSLFELEPETMFGTDFFGASGSYSNFDSSTFMPTDDLPSAPTPASLGAWGTGSEIIDWPALASQQELPLLPPPPPSSSPDAELVENTFDGSTASAAIATKDIDLEFSEKNIIHSKRQRTQSSRAAAALPASKKPRSR